MSRTVLTRPLSVLVLAATLAVAGCAADREVIDAASQKDYKTVYDISYPRAMKGDDDAMIRLSVLYAKGHFVEKDLSEALKWAYIAADKGHMLGQSLYQDLLQRASDDEIIESEIRIKQWNEENGGFF